MNEIKRARDCERDENQERMMKRAREEEHRANKAYRADADSEMKKGNRTIETTSSKERKQDSARARALIHVNDEMEKGNRSIAWTSIGARKQDCARAKTLEVCIEMRKGDRPIRSTASEEERERHCSRALNVETRKGQQRPIALSTGEEWKQVCSRTMRSMDCTK